jgi:hypothetical protein
MKKLFTLIAVILPLSSLMAQTFLKQDFGKTQEEVAEFLKTKNMVHTTQLDENVLVASTDAFTVTYHFDEGGLYKMETVSDFAKAGDANAKMETFKLQYLKETAEVMDLNTDKELTRFAALKGRELHEISAHSLGKNGAQIRLVSLDLDRSPGMAMNELQQDELLFAMIHK